MHIHKNTKITPRLRKEIWSRYSKKDISITDLAKQYNISRTTLHKVLQRARQGDYSVHKSTNKRYRCFRHGMLRLEKVEERIEANKRKEAKRYNKNYPGELGHMDTKKLPTIEGCKASMKEYMFVYIDDYSRELYCTITADKSQYSAALALEQVLEQCPYTTERMLTDNGKEYKGTTNHAFVSLCEEKGMQQKFTRIKRPQTNGKAEGVIRTLMDMWHNKTHFKSSQHRKTELKRFINYYNTVKPHKGIDNLTPLEKLELYFYPTEL